MYARAKAGNLYLVVWESEWYNIYEFRLVLD